MSGSSSLAEAAAEVAAAVAAAEEEGRPWKDEGGFGFDDDGGFGDNAGGEGGVLGLREQEEEVVVAPAQKRPRVEEDEGGSSTAGGAGEGDTGALLLVTAADGGGGVPTAAALAAEAAAFYSRWLATPPFTTMEELLAPVTYTDGAFTAEEVAAAAKAARQLALPIVPGGGGGAGAGVPTEAAAFDRMWLAAMPLATMDEPVAPAAAKFEPAETEKQEKELKWIDNDTTKHVWFVSLFLALPVPTLTTPPKNPRPPNSPHTQSQEQVVRHARAPLLRELRPGPQRLKHLQQERTRRPVVPRLVALQNLQGLVHGALELLQLEKLERERVPRLQVGGVRLFVVWFV